VVEEIRLDFGDGAVVFALVACDETTKPGDPVTMNLSWTYRPGTYMLKASAFSTPRCGSGPFQEGRPDKETLVVS
jgi:hypothetical protein